MKGANRRFPMPFANGSLYPLCFPLALCVGRVRHLWGILALFYSAEERPTLYAPPCLQKAADDRGCVLFRMKSIVHFAGAHVRRESRGDLYYCTSCMVKLALMGGEKLKRYWVLVPWSMSSQSLLVLSSVWKGSTLNYILIPHWFGSLQGGETVPVQIGRRENEDYACDRPRRHCCVFLERRRWAHGKARIQRTSMTVSSNTTAPAAGS